MKIAITGVTGNMGQATLPEVLKIDEIEQINLLVLPSDKRGKQLLKKYRRFRPKLRLISGNLADEAACRELTRDCDVVINLAAVIPPHSDKNPQAAVECNEIGVDILVRVLEALTPQPKLIHISTVALYGNRTSSHPYGRIGDPLLVSPYDIYAATKLRGEFRVLESSLENWVVLRQTAMLHLNMLKDNMSDGLMFHTCFNAPLEWVTAHDSGVLIANILRQDLTRQLAATFWRQCYNIGNPQNRVTGFDTLNDGFQIIGGTAKDFFRPDYNATRNFHGMWFTDSHQLNDLFPYQQQDLPTYWGLIAKKYWYYRLGKLIPKKVLAHFAIEKLLANYNAPAYWHQHGDTARLTAYFGGADKFAALPRTWDACPLLVENKDETGRELAYVQLQDPARAQLINYYFDQNKPTAQITLTDLQSVAQAHGGKLLTTSYTPGDMRTKLEWETQDGEKFRANAYTVLKAGHWDNKIYHENVWEFDRLAKRDKIWAQIWYDSHATDENNIYAFDRDFRAELVKVPETAR